MVDLNDGSRKAAHLKLVELQCVNSRCLFNKGDGKCGHTEPTIKLNFSVQNDGSWKQDFKCVSERISGIYLKDQG